MGLHHTRACLHFVTNRIGQRQPVALVKEQNLLQPHTLALCLERALAGAFKTVSESFVWHVMV